ncbi:hypothetical protein SKAU_G00073160 [Synaphobranchus kaupii]|uniref:Uncharacterized protein n=1 Tax=Synaphobranchus kaupii TaxID=118154 RepID=A0A9Q1G7M1_SYNKA|nr:hypothetical protein SKAU_G00073160 [Synaphobranchus kaupii]
MTWKSQFSARHLRLGIRFLPVTTQVPPSILKLASSGPMTDVGRVKGSLNAARSSGQPLQSQRASPPLDPAHRESVTATPRRPGLAVLPTRPPDPQIEL